MSQRFFRSFCVRVPRKLKKAAKYGVKKHLKLSLSEGTVRNMLSIILSKLELRDRTQLAIWAVQTGVVNRGFGEEP